MVFKKLDSLLAEAAVASVVSHGEHVPVRVLEYRPPWESFRTTGVFDDAFLVVWPGGFCSWEGQRFARRHPHLCAGAVKRWLEPIDDGAVQLAFVECTNAKVDLPENTCLVQLDVGAPNFPSSRRSLCLSAVSEWLAKHRILVMTWGVQGKRMELSCLSFQENLHLWSQEKQRRVDLEQLLTKGTHISSRVKTSKKRRR